MQIDDFRRNSQEGGSYPQSFKGNLSLKAEILEKNEENRSETLEKEGYLQRKSRNILISWKSVYFIVEKTRISWKKKNSDKDAKASFSLAELEKCEKIGTHEFSLVFHKLHINKVKKNTFFKVFKEKKFVFRTEDHAERNKWVKSIRNMKKNSENPSCGEDSAWKVEEDKREEKFSKKKLEKNEILNKSLEKKDLKKKKMEENAKNLKKNELKKENQEKNDTKDVNLEERSDFSKNTSVGQYGDSIFSKFYKLTGKEEPVKEPIQKDEEWKVPRKEPQLWKQIFCCQASNKFE